ncbi:MAG: beta-galactosidase [Kiritimatiellia bacterium]|jgi:hypothetical protein
MKFRTATFALASLVIPFAVKAEAPLFPFVMGGNEPNVGVADVSWLNDKPAGKHGFISVRNGHFVDGRGKRIRFLATNFTFASAFPTHEEADALAVRLASMGLNCVRFHHIDKHDAPAGIWLKGRPRLDTFDPEQLDKLDYFIAQLKKHGIYVNLNLHVSRQYWEGADFDEGLEEDGTRNGALPKYGKGLDKINDRMIAMQHDYARDLLTHVNPYTGLAYAADPCVAMVELNNENTLFNLDMDSLPTSYRRDIQAKWNAWLRRRYAGTAELGDAWGRAIPLGNELLTTAPVAEGRQYLAIEASSPHAFTGQLLKEPDQAWMAQVQWRNLTLENGRLYTFSYAIRSDVERTLRFNVRHQLPDWHGCGLSGLAKAGPEWSERSTTFVAANCTPSQTRIDFVLGDSPAGGFEMKDVSLRPGGERGLLAGESLEAGTVGLRSQGVSGTKRGEDWFRFLGETERAYVAGLKRCIRDELKCRAPIIDTQASYGGLSGVFRESQNDFIDLHSYWQHPSFPGRPWDMGNWRIKNTPMSREAQSGGNLGRLAAFRVDAMPFTVTEYDHPAPSHYSAEMFPMIASFAGAQDWDGIFQFDWGGAKAPDGKIDSYFSLKSHPGKLAFLPAAALLFRRGDVPAFPAKAVLDIPSDDLDARASRGGNMLQLWSQAGFETAQSLGRRQAVRFVANPTMTDPKIRWQGDDTAPTPIQWTKDQPYQVDVPTAKVVVGDCMGRTIRLKDIDIAFATNASGFASVALVAVDGRPVPESRKMLLAAAGNVENTGMGWNPERTTVGRAWGQAPTTCEGIGATIRLKTQPGDFHLYALDGKGGRKGDVPATVANGRVVFAIGPEFKTLWYEIARE